MVYRFEVFRRHEERGITIQLRDIFASRSDAKKYGERLEERLSQGWEILLVVKESIPEKDGVLIIPSDTFRNQEWPNTNEKFCGHARSSSKFTRKRVLKIVSSDRYYKEPGE